MGMAVIWCRTIYKVTSVTLQGLEIPRVTEFTFFRKDRFTPTGYARNFPHPLDRDNTANAPLRLPAAWYAPSV